MRNKFILTKEKDLQLLTRVRNSGLFNITWMMLLLLTVFMWQCRKDDFKGETTGVCPLVISTDPANNATSVVSSKIITATFNENMDPATINTTSFLLSQGTNSVTGTVTPTSGPTATFTPASPLAPFTLYTATIKKGVKDPMSNALQADYVWSFTTQPLVTVSSNPLIGGTTIGGGAFNVGASVTVKAVANAGYIFANWTEAGVVASTNAEYTFVIAGNRVLVANYTAQYSVTLSSLPLTGGTTSGGGTFNSGASVTISAVPSVGYTFTNWTEGATVVSVLKDYTFTISANRVFVANFAINMYLLNVTAINGTVVKNPDQTTFSHGTTVLLTATPSAGYTFTSWSGDATGAENPLTVTMNSDKNITANFSAIQYTVVLSSNPLLGGTTTGAGTYNSGASVIVRATPAAGYTFTNWTEGATVVSSNANYAFTISGNRTFVANFSAIQYTVALSSNPILGGTTSGAGTYNSGASVTVGAAPATGYTFKNWTEGATIVSSNANYTFTISGNKTFVANFTADIVQYTVSLSSNPLLGGTTTGAGSFDSGTSVTVGAVPAVGYTFTNWTEGANIVSSNANYTFTINGNKTFVANFTANIVQYTVALSSNPLLGGTTTGAGSYNSGASVTVGAIPAVGYTFKNWTDGTNIVSSNVNYAFTLNANIVLVANFTAVLPGQFTVVLSSNPLLGGTTLGAGSYNSGASVIVKAAPAIGYTFKNWTEGATIVSTNANYTFIISGNKTFVANFTANIVQYTVALSSNPLLGGTTTGAGSFDSGASVTAGAVAAVGYSFTNWTEGTNIVSSNANYTFTISGNKTLVANFTANIVQYTVALSSNPLLGGTTTGGGLYNSGASATLKAVPNVNYTFKNWTEGVTILSTNENYTIVVNSNKTLVANFTADVIPPAGPDPIDLGTAGDFTALTKSGVSTTGVTSVSGNIGVSPAAATAITGFGLIMDTNGQSSHTPIVSGKVYASDYAPPTPAKMTTAVSDMETAFTTGNNLVVPAPIVGLYAGDISGRTLPAGLYKWGTGVLITNAGVTLSGGANDVWVFQIAQNLTVNSSAIVHLIGGAQAKNIFWVVTGQATLGTNSDFSGIILSKTLISLNTGAKVTGKLLAQTAVTLNASTVTQP